MGEYTGAGALTDLVDRLESATQRTGRDLADNMVDHGKDLITRNTPVATHHLRDSYERTPIVYKRDALLGYSSVRWSMFVWTGSVFTEVEYAPYMERGTGLWGPRRKKFKIQPKKPGGVLAFQGYARTPAGAVILDVQGNVTKSGPVVVRFVMHPGSPGHHMFQIGATLTEAEYREWSIEPLRLWKQMVEHG